MTDQRIDSFDGAGLFVRVEGLADGPPVLLSHYLGGNLGAWDSLVEALGERCRLIRYDTRGQGASDAPEGPYSIEILGKDALAIMDALGLDRVSFVGVSQGGMTGMWLAANHPERVQRLVLANTTPFIPNKPVWDELIAKSADEGMARIGEATISGWLSNGFKVRDPIGARTAVKTMQSMSVAGYAGNCAVLRDVDLRDKLAAIACPTLVIGGAEDGPRGAAAPVMAETIPGARLTMIEDAAHLSPLENPTAFNAAVAEFLA